jgi:hypothetical protein
MAKTRQTEGVHRREKVDANHARTRRRADGQLMSVAVTLYAGTGAEVSLPHPRVAEWARDGIPKAAIIPKAAMSDETRRLMGSDPNPHRTPIASRFLPRESREHAGCIVVIAPLARPTE